MCFVEREACADKNRQERCSSCKLQADLAMQNLSKKMGHETNNFYRLKQMKEQNNSGVSCQLCE